MILFERQSKNASLFKFYDKKVQYFRFSFCQEIPSNSIFIYRSLEQTLKPSIYSLQRSKILIYKDRIMETKTKILATIGVWALWTILFMFINFAIRLTHISEAKVNDTKNRIISIIHGALIFWLCSIALFIQPNSLRKSQSHTATILIIISLSYFIYDTIACFYYKLLDSWLAFHHLVVIIAFSLSLIGFKGQFYLLVGLSLAQISNFPMHMRIIFRNLGLKHTKIYELLQNLYFFLYILARGIISPFFLLVPTLLDKNVSIILKLSIILIHLQSFYFIYDMASIIRKNVQRRSEMQAKNIEYQWFNVSQSKLSQLSFFNKDKKQ